MKHLLAVILSASALCIAPAQAERVAAAEAQGGSVFKCDGGRELNAVFTSRDSRAVAIVDAGDGAYVLALQPWDMGSPKATWSDGQRTLVWNVGVQIMLMDGGAHLSCGRSGGHKH